MAMRPTRCSRLARSLASGIFLCAAMPDSFADVPAASNPDAVIGASSIDVIADAGGAGAGAVLYLEVVINGNETHKLAAFTQVDGKLRAGAETLRQLGFRLSEQSVASVELDALPGVTYHYDEERQRIEFTAGEHAIDLERSVLNAPESTVPKPSASTGFLLNYDLYGTRDDSSNTGLSTFAEARFFGGFGVVSNTWLSRLVDSPGSDMYAESARLDTTWTRSFVDSATVMRFGDTI